MAQSPWRGLTIPSGWAACASPSDRWAAPATDRSEGPPSATTATSSSRRCRRATGASTRATRATHRPVSASKSRRAGGRAGRRRDARVRGTVALPARLLTISVSLYPEDATPDAEPVAQTARSRGGDFVFDGVAPGRWRLGVDLAGFSGRMLLEHVEAEEGHGGTPVEAIGTAAGATPRTTCALPTAPLSSDRARTRAVPGRPPPQSPAARALRRPRRALSAPRAFEPAEMSHSRGLRPRADASRRPSRHAIVCRDRASTRLRGAVTARARRRGLAAWPKLGDVTARSALGPPGGA